jgi:peptide/nickel transport system permease protein
MQEPVQRRSARAIPALRLVLVRALWSLVILVVAKFAVFVLLSLSPGDAAERIAGPEASTETIAEVRSQLRLDDPVVVQYGRWLGGAVRGDMGTSLITREPVTEMVVEALPRTLSLVLVASVMAILVAFAAGVVSAVYAGRAIDRIVVGATSLGVAAPSFWIGIVLVSTFAIDRPWFPAGGYTPIANGFGEWLSRLILPGAALAALATAELTRQLRGSLTDALNRDFTLTARAKGLSATRIVGKHALKNAAIPVVTVLGLRIAQLLGGAIIVERVFAIRGLGTITIDAVNSRDLPVVLGVVTTFSVMVILTNLVVDLSYSYFNPKIRTQSR